MTISRRTLSSSALLMALTANEGASKHTTASRLQLYGLALVIGALLSNLLDRAVAGGVLNFIQVGLFPIFNLAHVALVSGAALVGFSAWRAR